MGAAIDRAGVVLSLSCGLHCGVTPLLLGAVVGLPFGWLLEESTEALLLTAAIGTAAVSLGPSYWRLPPPEALSRPVRRWSHLCCPSQAWARR